MQNIPEIINGFNVYKDGTKLIGVSAEVSVPDLEAMTETISGAGILGEYDAANPGHYGAIDWEIPFRVLYGDIFELIDTTQAVNLTLRGSIQTSDGAGNKKFVGMRVVVAGTPKKLTGGTMKAGGSMGSSATIGVNYLKIEIGGSDKVELDKLNGIFKRNGKDVLGGINALC